MRVHPRKEPGTAEYHGPLPKMGVVYCIEDFWQGPQFNVVMLVGFGGFKADHLGRPIGWRASYFRKVDEIKLCVAAVKYADKPSEIVLEPIA